MDHGVSSLCWFGLAGNLPSPILPRRLLALCRAFVALKPECHAKALGHVAPSSLPTPTFEPPRRIPGQPCPVLMLLGPFLESIGHGLNASVLGPAQRLDELPGYPERPANSSP
jgi:hypothetical protein